jgi:uncharacterized protein GlcG (DUF336 family)
MNSLDAKLTQQILQRAEQSANELSINACITVVDTGAHLKAFHRMDGAALGPIDVSQRKARTSALFGCDSGDFGKVITGGELTGMELSNGGLAAFPGGLPIKVGNKLIGAIGVSGGSAEQDLIIATFALEGLA